MPVTTSDWLRLIESISSVPSDHEAVVRRLQAGGVEGDRAEWLVSVARRQRIGRAFERAGMFIVVVGLMWMMVYWFLALTGSPDAPGLIAMMPPFVVTFAGTVALAIGAVLNTVLDMDLFAFPRVPPELPPPRNVRSGRRQKHIVILLAGQVCLLVSVISMTTLPHVRNAVWLRQHGVE